jgi:hypothetical protein
MRRKKCNRVEWSDVLLKELDRSSYVGLVLCVTAPRKSHMATTLRDSTLPSSTASLQPRNYEAAHEKKRQRHRL